MKCLVASSGNFSAGLPLEGGRFGPAVGVRPTGLHVKAPILAHPSVQLQVERLDGGRARISWPTSGGQTINYLMRNEASHGPQDLALLYGMKLPAQILQVQTQGQAATSKPENASTQKTSLNKPDREAALESRQALLQQINQSLAQGTAAQ